MTRTPVPLLKPIGWLTGLVLTMVVARAVAQWAGLKVPWYLVHELVLMLVPVVWLLIRVVPRLDESNRIGFVVTCALFVSASAIAELLAIQARYWWFFEGLDPLSGLTLGAIPLEEFLSYPLLLSLPILWFVELSGAWPTEPVLGEERGRVLSRFCKRASVVALAAAGGLIVLALVQPAVALDPKTAPFVDDAGAIRYSAGPKHFGWTIVQLLGWAGTFWLAAAVAKRLRWRTLAIVVATYFPYALFVELLACGRGWWVWNAQQTIGVYAWVLPVESFSMYLTGALMPVLCFEWLKGVWAGERTTRSPPVPVSAPSS
jgi:hypothetical protein